MSIDVTPEQTLWSALVAAEVRAEMGRRKISGRDIARKLERSPNWVSLKTSGSQRMDLDELAAIAGALGVGMVELLRRAERALNGDYLLSGDKADVLAKVPLPRSPYPGGRRPVGRSDSRHPPRREKRTSPTR